MTFDKLDKTREQAVVTAIEMIIDRSRHDTDRGLDKIAADVLGGMDSITPELARRACEAFNKSKSVYTLQKRASEARAEEFELIDADEVHRLMYGYHQKAASLLILPARSHRDNIPELREKLQKVALDASEAPEPISIGCLEREIHRTSIRLERSVDKLRERVGMHKQASEDAIHRTCQVMRRLPRKQLKKVAHLVVNRYGDDGVRLVKLLGAYIEKELPIEKTAAAAIFPLREPFTSIAIAIDQARFFTKTNAMLKKTAGAADGVAEGYGAAKSAVGNSVRKLLDPVIRFAKSPVYQQVTKEQNKEDDGVFDASLRNQLQQLRATQSFVDIASDDFVKGYDLDETMQAFNNVVGTMPDLLDEKYGPWLKALVREQLVQGNVYDANTIKQLQDIGKEIKSGRITDVDLATKSLEAGKGGTLPGFQLAEAPKETPKQTAAPRVDKGDAQTKAKELALKEQELAQRAETEAGQFKLKNREMTVTESREARAREAAKRKQP